MATLAGHFALSLSPLVLVQVLSLLLSGCFVFYLGFLLMPTKRRPKAEFPAAVLEWHFLVPARDEEIVIGGTIDHLRSISPLAHVWVIDDASTDRTGDIVRRRASNDQHVHLVTRVYPNARTGKGDALNAAYRALCDWMPAERDTSLVVVGVVDADGRPSANCIEVCSGPTLLGDPSVGGAQVEVRMINRDDPVPVPDAGWFGNFFARTLITMQDIEFRSIAVAMQRSRSRWTKTVGMGGNGQFTRLSALADLDSGDAVVWRGSLIEDFELGLHLLIAGWETRFTTEAWIDQEALFSLKRYLVQRTRWSQGVMQCMGYLGRIWGSRNLTMPGIIELTYCLFQPWLSMLGLLLFPFLVISLSVLAVTDSAGLQHLLDHGGWTVLVVYAVAGMGPFLVWGILYRRRCAPERNFVVGLWWGVAYGAYVYASYVTAWRAAFRLVFRRSGWAKTRRNAEVMAAEPVEVAHVRALIDSYQGSLSETFDAGQGPQGLTIDWTPHNLESAV